MKGIKIHKNLLCLLLCVALLAAFMTGCTPKEPEEEVIPDYPIVLDGGRIEAYPLRIVSLSPSITGTLIDMMMDGRIVGISDYCDEPWGGQYYEFFRCGTAQVPNIPKIYRANPDVVLSPTQLTEENLRELQQLDIEVIILPTPTTFGELRVYYTDLFRILYGENEGNERAKAFLETFDARLSDIRSRVVRAETGASAVYVGPDVLNIATGDTLEGEILALLGLDNWGADYKNFIFPEELVADLMPEVLISSGNMSLAAIRASSCYSTTPAVQNGRVLQVDGVVLETRRPGLIQTIWQIGEWLYPEEFATEQVVYEMETPEPDVDEDDVDGDHD